MLIKMRILLLSVVVTVGCKSIAEPPDWNRLRPLESLDLPTFVFVSNRGKQFERLARAGAEVGHLGAIMTVEQLARYIQLLDKVARKSSIVTHNDICRIARKIANLTPETVPKITAYVLQGPLVALPEKEWPPQLVVRGGLAVCLLDTKSSACLSKEKAKEILKPLLGNRLSRSHNKELPFVTILERTSHPILLPPKGWATKQVIARFGDQKFRLIFARPVQRAFARAMGVVYFPPVGIIDESIVSPVTTLNERCILAVYAPNRDFYWINKAPTDYAVVGDPVWP